ncbi:hypothetical protein SDC9_209580 [bioreactor metagenome]|uniref:Uncharacterized protein n=1 Tax=bioreactor metagenome TaxID=1076179 RepID=A0A645JEE2_9ZZZZ
MRILLQQFQRQRPLTGNHHRMIEWRNPGKTLLLRQFNRFRFRFIKVCAMQQHFAAKPANGIDFDIRRRNRHHDQRLHAQTSGGKRHALGMVARRSGDHPVSFLRLGQPCHHRVSASKLEAVNGLPVFALHEDHVIKAR